MNVIVTKNGEYANRIVADTLDIAQELYGSKYIVEEEIISEGQTKSVNIKMDFSLECFCPVCQSVIFRKTAVCPKCGIILE